MHWQYSLISDLGVGPLLWLRLLILVNAVPVLTVAVGYDVSGVVIGPRHVRVCLQQLLRICNTLLVLGLGRIDDGGPGEVLEGSGQTALTIQENVPDDVVGGGIVAVDLDDAIL